MTVVVTHGPRIFVDGCSFLSSVLGSNVAWHFEVNTVTPELPLYGHFCIWDPSEIGLCKLCVPKTQQAPSVPLTERVPNIEQRTSPYWYQLDLVVLRMLPLCALFRMW